MGLMAHFKILGALLDGVKILMYSKKDFERKVYFCVRFFSGFKIYVLKFLGEKYIFVLDSF